MRKTYIIDKYELLHNDLYFSLNDSDKEKQFQPAGQVLADSDNVSFIYLVEEGDQYSYLSFPKNLWPQLVELLKSDNDPFLNMGDESIILSGFNEELRALIYNIEGNDNYGNDFVISVESAFETILVENVE